MPDATDISVKVLVKRVPDTPVLVIRDRQPADTMSTVIPAAYAELESYLRELGVEPTGPPITLCPYADDDGMVAVENSFPVEDGVPGRGRIETAVFPRARCCRSSTGATTTSSTARTALAGGRGARRARSVG